MKKLKNIFYSSSMLLVTLFFSCGYEPEIERAGSRPELSTQEVLAEQGYSILNEAISYAGLEETLQTADSVTILAPSDAAFVTFFEQVGVSQLSDIPSETVADVLSYHVLGAPYRSSGLPRTATTLSSDNVYFAADGSVNGKAVIEGVDLASNNAIILRMNKVLDVPAGNLYQQMQANDSLDVLVAAIDAAGLQTLFTGSDEYTVFAPTNQAFDGVDISALTTEELTAILSFHVVPSATFSQELPVNNKLVTLLGSDEENIQELKVIDGEVNGVPVINPNISANNGVIHVVEGILTQDFTLDDAFNPDVSTIFLQGLGFLDAYGPDAFGDVISGSGYSGIVPLVDTVSVYTPIQRLVYSSFPDDASAIDYIENHSFSGYTNIWALSNGSKATAINGSSYYIQTDVNGRTYTHTGVSNAFTNPTTSFAYYDGLISIPSGVFTPLPESNLLEVLDASSDYTLFAALVKRLGKESLLTNSEVTVFAVNNNTFAAQSGLGTVEAINNLDDEEDAALLEALDEVLSNHIVVSVNYSIYISSVLPELETSSGNTLDIISIQDAPVIVIDSDLPESENVAITVVDIPAANGAIHEVESFIFL